MITIENFAHVQDGRLRLALEHWLAIRAGAAVPRRQDLDPVAIAHTLPFLALYQFNAEDEAFHCRLAGEEMCLRFHGQMWRGRRLDDLIRPEAYRLFSRALREAIERPAVVHGIGHFQFGDVLVPSEAIMLPLAGRAERPDAVLHVLVGQIDEVAPEKLDPVHFDLLDTITPLSPTSGPAGASYQRPVHYYTAEHVAP